MIFRDLLTALHGDVAAAVNELFATAEKCQTHPQDILLVLEHGFYCEGVAQANRTAFPAISPYMIGLDEIGLAEQTFYELMDGYRQSHMLDRDLFAQARATDQSVRSAERLALQLELNIYLRFWEADYLLKQYCQLARLAVADAYKWHLAISVPARRGSKQDIIRRDIHERLKDACPAFAVTIGDCYNSQLRNAIAHSQYYLAPNSIGLLNHSTDPKAHAPLASMSFEHWYVLFHTTLLLYDKTKRALHKHRARYRAGAGANQGRLPVRITKIDGTTEIRDLRLHGDRWVWDTQA